MLLSVIIPVYNVRDCLRRCVNSLLKIDAAEDYEILLVDDGSPDDSGKICDEYSALYDYVRTFHKINGGLSDARNFGLNEARGEYVVFIDSDDYVEAGSVQKICESIKNRECDIYCTDYYSLCGSLKTDLCYTPTDEVKSGAEFLRYQLERRSMVSSVVQNIYRRTMLTENGLFFKKGIYHEDEEWYPRVFLSASSVRYLDFVYYVYIIRENSIMQQKNLTKHIKDFISTMRFLTQECREKTDDGLFCLLKDSLVDKYLSIYARGNFGNGNDEVVLSAKELRGGLVHRKTKIKLAVFLINRSLFCRISRMYNARS
jgi:glycosyltransferase involved in cell wall biosynthesis